MKLASAAFIFTFLFLGAHMSLASDKFFNISVQRFKAEFQAAEFGAVQWHEVEENKLYANIYFQNGRALSMSVRHNRRYVRHVEIALVYLSAVVADGKVFSEEFENKFVENVFRSVNTLCENSIPDESAEKFAAVVGGLLNRARQEAVSMQLGCADIQLQYNMAHTLRCLIAP